MCVCSPGHRLAEIVTRLYSDRQKDLVRYVFLILKQTIDLGTMKDACA